MKMMTTVAGVLLAALGICTTMAHATPSLIIKGGDWLAHRA